jgi:hypothetical protein
MGNSRGVFRTARCSCPRAREQRAPPGPQNPPFQDARGRAGARARGASHAPPDARARGASHAPPDALHIRRLHLQRKDLPPSSRTAAPDSTHPAPAAPHGAPRPLLPAASPAAARPAAAPPAFSPAAAPPAPRHPPAAPARVADPRPAPAPAPAPADAPAPAPAPARRLRALALCRLLDDLVDHFVGDAQVLDVVAADVALGDLPELVPVLPTLRAVSHAARSVRARRRGIRAARVRRRKARRGAL